MTEPEVPDLVAVAEEFESPGDAERVDKVLRYVTGEVDSLRGLRILDLACRTGVFARSFAKAGAVAVGIEGKTENFNRIPSTPNATFFRDDVRNLSAQKYGTFDITLCLGILYHLGPEDVVSLLRSMRKVTKTFALIDTHVAITPYGTATAFGCSYDGRWFHEEPVTLWSSVGNVRSWWFTEESLACACADAGWGEVTFLGNEAADRRWIRVS